MPTISPYLYFNGRGDEAIEFYQRALGAQVEMLMRFNESPDPVPEGILPSGFENKIMHATINVKGNTILISDGCEETGTFTGFSLALSLENEEEAHASFNALAEGGSVCMPLAKTFWSPCYGMVTDRFGIAWMVMVLPN